MATPPPDGYRFSGDGYVIMGMSKFNPSRTSPVTFDFRTYSENGLMFLMGEEDVPNGDFFSIEMKNGRVLFQYDLGSGMTARWCAALRVSASAVMTSLLRTAELVVSRCSTIK